MAYVIDRTKKYVAHQGPEKECEQYVRNVCELFGRRRVEFEIARNATERRVILNGLK